MNRPECLVPECKNDALVMFSGKLICGECYASFYKRQQEKQWENFLCR